MTEEVQQVWDRLIELMPGPCVVGNFSVVQPVLMENSLRPAVLGQFYQSTVLWVVELPLTPEKGLLALSAVEGHARGVAAWVDYLRDPGCPEDGRWYQHYKGGRYQIVAPALMAHDFGGPAETIDRAVVYADAQRVPNWARTFTDFTGVVSVARFALIEGGTKESG